MISLGCPKNQVNAERMLALITNAGMEIADDLDGADAVIVNTCGFIDDAKREAIESILEVVELKKQGLVGAVIAAGCLAERYRGEMMEEIPELDAVLGLGANEAIVDHIKTVCAGDRAVAFPDLGCLPLSGERLRTTPAHWAYLQIADGCSNHCTYCKIPSIRGRYRSRPMDDIITEAKQLAADGVKELILIAQDTTRYGGDLPEKTTLAELLRHLCGIDGILWIRLLYAYPDAVTDELIDVIAAQPKIVKYIDLPLQHADDAILSAMGRRGTQAELRTLIAKLRERVRGIAIRTTFITGFPGEDEESFAQLAAFVRDMRFEKLGVFAFSPQDGTPAYALEPQVPAQTAAARAENLMQLQNRIVLEQTRARIGQTFAVVVENYDNYTDSYQGRCMFDAPDIDNVIYLTSAAPLDDGDFVNAVVLGERDGDLLGRVCE
jgi:ribosomal protein S12 methylthiotransferase